MDKRRALKLLGGMAATAEAVEITTEAVRQWPDPLPRRIADRVIAALVRQGKVVPPELIEMPSPAANSDQSEAA